MKRIIIATAVISLLASSVELRAATTLPAVLQLFGQVTAASHPVEDAVIVAFGLKNFGSHEAVSDRSGSFRLAALPSDVYRLIAIKHGFAPAVATIVPSAADLRVQIRLREGKPTSEALNDIWEIRRSLPADVLRELDQVMSEQSASSEPQNFRLSGAMSSLTGMASDTTGPDSAQTAVNLNGTSPSGWSVDIAGRMHEIQDTPLASSARTSQSSGLVMAVKTSPEQSVRIASMRNSWKRDQDGQPGAADLESHRIEWSRPDTNFELRYTSQQNLYGSPLLNSEVLELSGRRQLLQSSRSDLNVEVQVWQESANSITSSRAAPSYRVANLGTTGSHELGSTARIHYGLRTRMADGRQQWAPESSAELHLTHKSSLVASGMYTVGRSFSQFVLPTVAPAEELGSISPRYRYSFGVVNADRKGNEVSALMTVAAIDSTISMLFDDAGSASSLWDAYLLEAGDVHRDLTLAVRHNFGKQLYVDVTTTAARTDSAAGKDERVVRHFVVSNVETLYRPSGTSVALTYRLIEQPDRAVSPLDLSGERLSLRLGQSLHLPLDLKLLAGIDLSRDRNSTVASLNDPLQKRYLGGISLAF